MKDTTKKGILGMFVLLFLSIFVIILVAAIIGNNASQDDQSLEPDSIQEVNKSWVYSTDVDKMSGEITYWAQRTSTNTLFFEFPYNGGSSFTLSVRNRNKENEVILQVSKGQFITSVIGMESCRVRFDDEKPINFTYNSADDGSADVIFFNRSNKFISKLKKAKKVMIEAQFFQEGNRIIEFNVDGLKWDR